MREIGGYIELDEYSGPMLHDQAIALNCGRSCLAYLIESRSIRKIALPLFLCDVVRRTCEQYGVRLRFYPIDEAFSPQIPALDEDEWLYVVNFYGQITAERMETLVRQHPHIIVDNAQAYFDLPIPGVDTLYTCRKFLGVSDGGFLYTDAPLARELPLDASFDRVRFVLGRYERSAPEFYRESSENNERFSEEPVMRMSRLTQNLLHGINYEWIKQKRTENYVFLAERLDAFNRLAPRRVEGAYAYPLWVENGAQIRKTLAQKKIYIPCLWPNVLTEAPEHSLEYDLAGNILPLPCDQRYDTNDMLRVIGELGYV